MVAKSQVVTDDIIFFLQDHTTKAIAEEVIGKLENTFGKVFDGGVSEATNFLKTTMYSKIIVVDASKSSLMISDVEKLMHVCSPDATVIIIGQANEISLFRDLIKLNVSDYIIKPLNFDILMRTIVDALKREPYQKRVGKVVSFLGVKGGVGTTMLTTNCAHVMANVRQRKVALVDGDIFFGHVPLMFDLRLSHALSDALENPERIDDIFLDQAMAAYGNHLRILSSEEPLHGDPVINDEQQEQNFRSLIHTLKTKFHYVMIDLSRHTLRLWKNIMLESNMMFLVTDLSTPGLRDLVRIKSVLTDEAPTLRFFIIVNHIRQRESLPLHKFEKYLGASVDLVIPYFPQAEKSINFGVPLSSSTASYQSYINQIIRVLSGEPVQKGAISAFNKFLARLGLSSE
jgi:pilus assembly protein CpaE